MFTLRYITCFYILISVVNFYGSTNALKCYVCTNCNEVTEEDLQTCPSRPITQPTTVGPTESTAAPPATTESTPATTESTPATTESTPATTESTPTTTESTPTTTESTPTTTESTPTTTESTPTTTESTPTTTESTPTTTESTPATTESTTASEANNGSIDLYGMNAPQRVFLRTLKQLRENDEEDAARCLVTSFEENGETKTIRGCAFASDDIEESCRNAVGTDYNGPLRVCRVCAAEGCNSAVKSTTALLVLAMGVFVNLYLMK